MTCKAVMLADLGCEYRDMEEVGGQVSGQQVAEAMAAERESLSLECRADPAQFGRLLAPDFHEFGASGGEIGYEETAELVAAAANLGTP